MKYSKLHRNARIHNSELVAISEYSKAEVKCTLSFFLSFQRIKHCGLAFLLWLKFNWVFFLIFENFLSLGTVFSGSLCSLLTLSISIFFHYLHYLIKAAVLYHWAISVHLACFYFALTVSTIVFSRFPNEIKKRSTLVSFNFKI